MLTKGQSTFKPIVPFCKVCNAAPCMCRSDPTPLNKVKAESRWQGPCATCGRAPCRCLYMTPGQKMPDVTLTEADVDRIAFRVIELLELRGR